MAIPLAILEPAAKWLLAQAGGSMFNSIKQRLLEQMGLSSPPLTASNVKVLLDNYYQRFVEASTKPLRDRLDEDRLAKLKSAIEQLKRASKTGLKQGVLISALNDFSHIANLPEQGETGGFPNGQLRCLAFLGIAAIHAAVNDPPNLIAENIAAAVSVDLSTATLWFGTDIIREILVHNPNLTSSRPSPIRSPGTVLLTYTGHAYEVSSVAWSPDGKYIASAGSYDHTVQVWEAMTGKKWIDKKEASAAYIPFVAWSPDGKYIASAGDNHTAQVWEALTGKLRLTSTGLNRGGWSIFSAAWSPDGKYIASKSSYHVILVWEALTEKLRLTYHGHKGAVHCVAWSPDGKYIASGGGLGNYAVQVWEAMTGKQRLAYTTDHKQAVRRVAWSPDGKYIASAEEYNHTVQVWEALTGKQRLTYTGHKQGHPICSAAWSPDGKYIASGGYDHTVQVWEALTGKQRLTYTGHKGTVCSVAWSPDGKYIASGGLEDHTVQVWEAPD